MKILAIESSAIVASVALLEDNRITAQYTIDYGKTHSQTLLPMIDEIFKMTDTDVESVDVYAVSTGPGSFTGLRIGAATGKGMALACKKPMVAVPTLDAIAYNMYGRNELICCIMDARRQHLYNNIYSFDDNNKLTSLRETQLSSYEELAEEVNGIGRKVIFVGDGIEAAKNTFDQKIKVPVEYAPAHLAKQNAASLAMLAKEMYERGEVVDAAALHPDYLRPSQAEREKEGC